jgi:predicted ATPase/DNA-binding SARP family transcriptional activator
MSVPRSALQIHTLGDVSIELESQPVTKLTKPAKALLVILALDPLVAHSRESLAHMLWLSPADAGDDREEARAQASLRTALKTLRAQLGEDIFLEDKQAHTLQLNPDRPVWLDAVAFEQAAAACLDAPRAHALPLDLVHGDFMPGYDDLPAPGWIEHTRTRVRAFEQQLCVLDARNAKRRGDYSHALAQAERALRQSPTNQDACAEAMWVHWRLNQPQRALETYEELKRALREENQVPLNALRQLRSKIQNDLERNSRRALLLTNLPHVETSFIGRARELQELRALLRPREGKPRRLVTLIGPGGSGKTRLARELAASVLKQYRDGVWWVELDALEKDKGDVARAVAGVLGIRAEPDRPLLETLTAFLRDKKMLLVLDNCEHVLEPSAAVCSILLSHCPGIQIIATSRSPLRVAGEKGFHLAAFELPKAMDAASLTQLARNDAVRLFLDRTQQEQENFTLNADNAREIIQLCRRLDGLPLALELAAARLRTLTLSEIVAGLDERFELLKYGNRAPARHETLRAVLDWSFDLMNDDERALLALLGVFAGRFTEQAVRAVVEDDTASPAAISDTLESLVEKSMVQLDWDAEGVRRFRLLESVRAYARDKLDALSPDADAVYVRMARYYLEFAKSNRQDYIALEREWDNLSYGLSIFHWQESWQEVLEFGYALTDAAFARGLYTQARAIFPLVMQAAGELEEQQADIQVRLDYARAFIEQGFYPQAREVLTQLLRVTTTAQDPFGITGARMQLAWLDIEQGNLPAAESVLPDVLQEWEQQGNHVLHAETLIRLAQLRYRAYDFDEADRLAQAALDELAPTDEILHKVHALQYRAHCASLTFRFDEAAAFCQQALVFCADKFPDMRADTLYLLSQVQNQSGRHGDALANGLEALETFRQNGARKSEAYALNHLVSVYLELGDYPAALRAGRDGLALLDVLGDEWSKPYIYRDLGRVYQRMNQKKRARTLWLRALEQIESDFPDHKLKNFFLQALSGSQPTADAPEVPPGLSPTRSPATAAAM